MAQNPLGLFGVIPSICHNFEGEVRRKDEERFRLEMKERVKQMRKAIRGPLRSNLGLLPGILALPQEEETPSPPLPILATPLKKITNAPSKGLNDPSKGPLASANLTTNEKEKPNVR